MSKDTDHTIDNLRDEIQEIDERVDELENENYDLKQRIAELEAEIGERDALIAQMEADACDANPNHRDRNLCGVWQLMAACAIRGA